MGKKENKGGRPPYFKTPNELEEVVNDYFMNCPDKHSIIVNDTIIEEDCPTITGLVLHLGFESRQSFYDYGKREEFSYIIKRSQLRVKNVYEKLLRNKSCVGAIFALKNMGWKDSQEIITEDKTERPSNVNIIIHGSESEGNESSE